MIYFPQKKEKKIKKDESSMNFFLISSVNLHSMAAI